VFVCLCAAVYGVIKNNNNNNNNNNSIGWLGSRLVLGRQPAGDISHKPGGRLPLLSARLAVTPATGVSVKIGRYSGSAGSADELMS